jgi:spermidine synthase
VRVNEYEKDCQTVRELRRNTNRSSAIYLDTYEHVYNYSQFADLHDQFGSESLLLLGGGAYTIPRRITGLYPNKHITVAEIDHTLYPLAQKYFDLKHPDRIHNYAMDARVYVNQTTEKYDFVFVDTYGSSRNIPFHLATVEFVEQLKSILTEDGVVMVNYIGMVDNNPDNLTARFIATYLEVFPELAIYQTGNHDYMDMQNNIIIAYNNPSLNPNINDFAIRYGTTTIPISELQVETEYFTANRGKIFTDNNAPTEYLTNKQMSAYMRNL